MIRIVNNMKCAYLLARSNKVRIIDLYTKDDFSVNDSFYSSVL
jgi:hypothetical protein